MILLHIKFRWNIKNTVLMNKQVKKQRMLKWKWYQPFFFKIKESLNTFLLKRLVESSQPSSSDPSPQSNSPSHTNFFGIQKCFDRLLDRQWNKLGLDSAGEHGSLTICSGAGATDSTYGSFSSVRPWSLLFGWLKLFS